MCGVEPVWASEIEPFPIAVTRSRFPNMKHLGDISKINGGEVEPVDIITFGSPCQDLSVAGKRAGLKHEDNGDDETTRSGLFMEAIRIIKEMRNATNGKYPRYAVWENVPGAFSSNKGKDFRIVLEELVRISEPTAVMPKVPKGGWAYADVYCGNGWSLAYRVLDAQHWGVPQRRRRIYLVADFGGQRAGKILFEREGLRGYLAEGGTPWESTSAHVEGSIGADDREGTGLDIYNLAVTGDVAASLTTATGQGASNTGPSVAIPYTLKIRSGCEGGGKGALIQTDLSATLSTLNDQYLFQPVAAGFCPEQSAKTRGIGWEEGMAPTLRAGVTPAVTYTLEPGIAAREGGHIYETVCGTLRAEAGDNRMAVAYSIENHPADSRVNVDDSGKVQTLTSRMGTGGGNVPMVMEPVAYNGENITSPLNKTNPQPGDPCHTLGTDSRNYLVYCLQGNGIDRADTAGCNGKGWNDETCYTLNTIDRPAVVYAETYQKVTGPLMANSHPGSYTGQDAYNDMFVVGKEKPICVADHPTPKIDENGIAYTLNARDYKAPLCAAYGVDCRNFIENKELYPTLQAKSNGGQSLNYSGAVRVRYIVRRLTPTECARLQGFPDLWGHPDIKESLSDEEYNFWLGVRNLHADINGKATKEYTREQMLTWYNKLHTDSSEYKMWGNGIALPCALYVMQGIAEVLYGN